MDIWRSNKWEAWIDPSVSLNRSGLRFRIDAGVHPEVRRSCLEFGKWLRKEYRFPVRVPVYVRNVERLKCRDGDWAYGTFFWTNSFSQEPYIRIAAGDYLKLLQDWGRECALTAILKTITHEITHYYQWLNRVSLTDVSREKQASAYSRRILNLYATTHDEP